MNYHYSEWRKLRNPRVFCVAVKELSLQRGRFAFSVIGVLTVARNFLAAVVRFCPPFTECTCCSEEESRCSYYSLPSPMLAYSLQRKISPLQRLSKVLAPKKFSNFFFWLGKTPL